MDCSSRSSTASNSGICEAFCWASQAARMRCQTCCGHIGHAQISRAFSARLYVAQKERERERGFMSELDSRSAYRALLKTVQRPICSSFVFTISHSNLRLLCSVVSVCVIFRKPMAEVIAKKSCICQNKSLAIVPAKKSCICHCGLV